MAPDFEAIDDQGQTCVRSLGQRRAPTGKAHPRREPALRPPTCSEICLMPSLYRTSF
jgi:hypothetical protein